MTRRRPLGQLQWSALFVTAFVTVPALTGATLNPIAINASSGGPYVSTNYVSGSPVAGFDGLGNGIFTADNEIQWFTFTIGTPTDILIQTISWATMGGFTPELTLFTSAGAETGIGGTGSYATFPGCGAGALGVIGNLCQDAIIRTTLDTGSYRLALTQAGNSSLGSESAGFQYDGANNPCETPNYTSLSCSGAGGEGPFHPAYDVQTQLNGKWALSVGAGVPEPASGLLIFFGFAALLAVSKLRARHLPRQQVCPQSCNR